MISALVNTWNEEKNIANCLSCLSWCDEIVVVDMHSQDKTREIAARFTDKIYLHPHTQYVEPARQFGVDKTKGDWVFILDADEMITPTLAEELKRVAQEDSCAAVRLPWQNYILGKWMKKAGWWPDCHVRFFKRNAVEFNLKIHGPYTIKGRVKNFPPREELAIIHFSYRDTNEFVERMNRYTDIEAKNLLDLGESYTLLEAFLKANKQFFSRYLWQGGFKAGWRGLFLSLSMGYYRFLSYFKYRERHEQDGCRLNVEYDYLERAEHILQQWSDFAK